MLADEFRGTLLKEFPPSNNTKFGRIYWKDLVVWFSVPEIFVILFFYWKDLFSLGPFFVAVPFIFLIMDVPAFLLLQHILTPRMRPLLVYTNGIFHEPSYWDRLRGRSGFISKDAIEKVVFNERDLYPPQYARFHGAEVVISIKGRKSPLVSWRVIAESNELMPLFRDQLRIPVEFIPVAQTQAMARGAHKVPVNEAAPAAASHSANNFCMHCGGALAADDAFCTACGQRVAP
jgi:hypothetical protein